MSSSTRTAVLVVALLAFVGSALLVVLDPGDLGSWAAAFVTAAVVVVTVADMRSARR